MGTATRRQMVSCPGNLCLCCLDTSAFPSERGLQKAVRTAPAAAMGVLLAMAVAAAVGRGVVHLPRVRSAHPVRSLCKTAPQPAASLTQLPPPHSGLCQGRCGGAGLCLGMTSVFCASYFLLALFCCKYVCKCTSYLLASLCCKYMHASVPLHASIYLSALRDSASMFGSSVFQSIVLFVSELIIPMKHPDASPCHVVVQSKHPLCRTRLDDE